MIDVYDDAKKTAEDVQQQSDDTDGGLGVGGMRLQTGIKGTT
jgi:hypothetical protein